MVKNYSSSLNFKMIFLFYHESFLVKNKSINLILVILHLCFIYMQCSLFKRDSCGIKMTKTILTELRAA